MEIGVASHPGTFILDDTEEDPEDVHAPRAGSRGRRKNQFVIELTDQ